MSKLIGAVKKNNIEEVKKIIKSGANLDEKDSGGNTALIWASWEGYTDIVKELIKSGANLDEKDSGGNTALICASWEGYEGYTEIVKELIKSGANREGCDMEKLQPVLDKLKIEKLEALLV